MDELLPITLFDAIQCLFLILGALVVVCIVNPYIIIAMPFILTIFMILRWLYMNTSRQVKRIESVTRSPVYSHLSGKEMIRIICTTLIIFINHYNHDYINE